MNYGSFIRLSLHSRRIFGKAAALFEKPKARMHDRLVKQENGKQGGLQGQQRQAEKVSEKTRHTRAAAVMLPQITRLSSQSKGLHTWYRTKGRQKAR